jgi:hypothetical protein
VDVTDDRGVPRILIVLIAVLPLALPASAAASGSPDRWQRPLPGATVSRTFSFDAAAPYERGRRRGIDLAARPDAPVFAACPGVVTYAGRVPGWGRGVTVRCGALVATELGLGTLTTPRGARVPAGALLGRLGARGVLRLGARRAGSRHGYVDPLALLDGPGPGAETPPPALAPPPRRRVSVPPASPPTPAPREVPAGVPAARAAPTALPWTAWAGLGLLAAGAGGGGVARHRRRSGMATGKALAQR